MEQTNTIHYKTTAVLFGGIGGESSGLLQSQVEYGGKLYKFKLLCSIDSDPNAVWVVPQEEPMTVVLH